MRLPRVLRVLVVLTAATATWTAGIMVADAAPVPPAAPPAVEVYAPDGTITRVPVRPGAALQPGGGASIGKADALTAP